LTWKFVALTAVLGGGNADAADSGAAPPVGGVRVCVDAMPAIACATSGADGTFTLAGLPTGTRLRITGDKSGYRSALMPVAAAAPTDIDLTANPVALLSASSPDPSIGAAIDWTNSGQILFFLLGPSAAGATSGYGDPGSSVALSPPSGTGFKYLNKDNTFSSGTAFTDVLGLAFNVAPADYLADITSHDTCAPIPSPEAWGYTTTTPDAVGLPVLAGHVTYAGAFCLAGPDAGPSDAGTSDAAE
jgi:hypothetical protein